MSISHQGFVIGDGDHPGVCNSPTHPDTFPRQFVGRAPGMDRCHSCWYSEQLDEADAEFQPLIDAIVANGIDAGDVMVDQTGGMVMCLRVVIERGTTRTETSAFNGTTYEVTPERYIYVSDMCSEFEVANFGYYDDIYFADDPNDPNDNDCEGEMVCHDTFMYDDHADFGKWVAEWVLDRRANPVPYDPNKPNCHY